MSFRQLSKELREVREHLGAALRRRLGAPLTERRARLFQRCRDFDPSPLLATPVNQTRIIVLDTETTGLQPYAGDALVEIAMLEYCGLEFTGQELCSLIHPGRHIPTASTVIHGLTDMDVVDAPSLERILDDILEFLDGALIVGHHVGFDLRFLNRAALRHVHCRLPNPALNTMTLFQIWTGRRGLFGLDEVARTCGVPIHERHNARADAVVCGEVFRRLATELTGADATVGDLLALSPPDPEYGPDYSRPLERPGAGTAPTRARD
ncbi:3'-5' exonuclease [Aquisalimonas sp. 2447]|uniref:3'-5' exonuclease n=1 Tax=Aquisalimonas sp. 2447 TaxID=2740807 RepID=UPI0014326855|nr:3'-5' exonuclease [Aquisalimonas sp. 2447]QIT55636.1 3'-5' exonuclease [Aquisalimonas sp. 2447]